MQRAVWAGMTFFEFQPSLDAVGVFFSVTVVPSLIARSYTLDPDVYMQRLPPGVNAFTYSRQYNELPNISTFSESRVTSGPSEVMLLLESSFVYAPHVFAVTAKGAELYPTPPAGGDPPLVSVVATSVLPLVSGVLREDAVPSGGFVLYTYLPGDTDEVTISVRSIDGDADLYVGTEPLVPVPRGTPCSKCLWSSEGTDPEDSVTIHGLDLHQSPRYYVAVRGSQASLYQIVAVAVTVVVDGARGASTVDPGASRHFVLRSNSTSGGVHFASAVTLASNAPASAMVNAGAVAMFTPVVAPGYSALAVTTLPASSAAFQAPYVVGSGVESPMMLTVTGMHAESVRRALGAGIQTLDSGHLLPPWLRQHSAMRKSKVMQATAPRTGADAASRLLQSAGTTLPLWRSGFRAWNFVANCTSADVSHACYNVTGVRPDSYTYMLTTVPSRTAVFVSFAVLPSVPGDAVPAFDVRARWHEPPSVTTSTASVFASLGTLVLVNCAFSAANLHIALSSSNGSSSATAAGLSFVTGSVFNDICPPYIWTPSEWSPCSVDCGNGTQHRRVSCQAAADSANTDSVSDDAMCDSLLRPDSTRQCSMGECDWYTGPWTECSAVCGGGRQQRDVHCSNGFGAGEPVPSTSCNSPAPQLQQVCNTVQCQPVYWQPSAWSACSRVRVRPFRGECCVLFPRAYSCCERRRAGKGGASAWYVACPTPVLCLQMMRASPWEARSLLPRSLATHSPAHRLASRCT